MEKENLIATKVLDSAFKVHRALGPGLLESAYEAAMAFELNRAGMSFGRQQEIEIVYEGVSLSAGFRTDFLVERLLIVELKSIEKILPLHPKQVLTYLRLANLRLGLLINFNEVLLKHGISRIAN